MLLLVPRKASLGELESDGLLHSWEASSTAGSARQVYAVTVDGLAMLGQWMGVIADERAALDNVLKRYDGFLSDEVEPNGFDAT